VLTDFEIPPLREDSFERRYEDVLQNIEFGIIHIFRAHSEMTDWEALSAIEALVSAYGASARGHELTRPALDPLTQMVYDFVASLCEWRLGRNQSFLGADGKPVDIAPEPITLDELLACLKRVRKSIKKWNRRGGQRGYLNFVSQFLP
jgi:hypothetical protein